jgi:hypothetical protein
VLSDGGAHRETKDEINKAKDTRARNYAKSKASKVCFSLHIVQDNGFKRDSLLLLSKGFH